MTSSKKTADLFCLNDLQSEVRKGTRPKFLFFWNDRQRVAGQIDKSCFSQWSTAPFQCDGQHYRTSEHYMMAQKAKLFGDEQKYAQILDAKHPGEAKKLGSEVLGFSSEIWDAKKFDIVVRGNQEKFGQNPELGAFLASTRNRVLVEASPRDVIWGIGLDDKNERAQNPLLWKGQNLLGFALMKARSQLLEN